MKTATKADNSSKKREEAEAVLRLNWEARHPERDKRLPAALEVLGISLTRFNALRRAMRRVTGKLSPLCVLTPAGHGRRV